VLPDGYASVSVSSLVPAELADARTGDDFVSRLPQFDDQFDSLRREATQEGQVLRFVGVIDAASGTIKAELARSVLYTVATLETAEHQLSDTPLRTRSRPLWEARTTLSCFIRSDTGHVHSSCRAPVLVPRSRLWAC
jgi:hypothetical protein